MRRQKQQSEWSKRDKGPDDFRVDLNVSIEQHVAAAKQGAVYDAAKKVWFAPDADVLSRCSRWTKKAKSSSTSSFAHMTRAEIADEILRSRSAPKSTFSSTAFSSHTPSGAVSGSHTRQTKPIPFQMQHKSVRRDQRFVLDQRLVLETPVPVPEAKPITTLPTLVPTIPYADHSGQSNSASSTRLSFSSSSDSSQADSSLENIPFIRPTDVATLHSDANQPAVAALTLSNPSVIKTIPPHPKPGLIKTTIAAAADNSGVNGKHVGALSSTRLDSLPEKKDIRKEIMVLTPIISSPPVSSSPEDELRQCDGTLEKTRATTSELDSFRAELREELKLHKQEKTANVSKASKKRVVTSDSVSSQTLNGSLASHPPALSSLQ